MVYEYLLQFTDDPYVKETLRFLMTREVAHYQQFEAALNTIKPLFPMGTLQGEPRFSNLYFNMSTGNSVRGPWNQGQSTQLGETWQYVEDPIKHVLETNSLLDQKLTGTDRTDKEVKTINSELGSAKKEFINAAAPMGPQQWNKPLSDDNGSVLETGSKLSKQMSNGDGSKSGK